MWFHLLACDYDGTLATAGRIAAETMAALGRARDSGRRIVLVTGRQFDDLVSVCPQLDFFDLVVAENGAVLHEPVSGRVELLADPPPAAFLRALEAEDVPFSAGRVIVASVVPHEGAILQTIKRLGLELHIIFNKEAVMVLPSAVSKATGLREGLRRLGVSRHNTVAIGDAENDHDFLRASGFAVAVANAVPALADAADLVTGSPNGAGVRELVDGPLRDDLEAYHPHLLERVVELGRTPDGTPVTYPVLGPNLLITGAVGSGKSTLTRLFVDELVRQDYVVCLLDPEGDCRALAGHEGVVVMRSESGTEETRAQEVETLLRHRSTSVAIDLSALAPNERVGAAARFLSAVQRLRATTGAPHWTVIDEAHRLFPDAGSGPAAAFHLDGRGFCLVTSAPERLAPEALRAVGHVISTSIEGLARTLPGVGELPAGELVTGEAIDVALADGRPPAVRRFRVAPGGGREAPAAAGVRGDVGGRGV